MDNDAQLLEYSSSEDLSQEEGFYYKEADDDDDDEAAGRESPEKERRLEIRCEKESYNNFESLGKPLSG